MIDRIGDDECKLINAFVIIHYLNIILGYHRIYYTNDNKSDKKNKF